VRFNNRPGDRQPHAHAVLLGRVKGVENAFWVADPGPLVLHLDLKHLVVQLS
jgi:hypothetical protein